MFKLITILSIACKSDLCQGEAADNIEGFIYSVKQQNARNIQNYDTTLEMLNQTVNAQVDTVETTKQQLLDTLAQTEEYLKILQATSAEGQRCVDKYAKTLPIQANIELSMNSCVPSDFLENPWKEPKSYRYQLKGYYTYDLDIKILDCKDNEKAPTNCILAAVDKCETFTAKNRVSFNEALDSSLCSAKAALKTVLGCSFGIERTIISAIAETTLSIDRCVFGQNNCNDGSKTNLCSVVKCIHRSQVSTTSQTMKNPYYGSENISDCAILQIHSDKSL